MIVRLSHRHSTGKPAKKMKDTLNKGGTKNWINIPNKLEIPLHHHNWGTHPPDLPPHDQGTILTLTQE